MTADQGRLRQHHIVEQRRRSLIFASSATDRIELKIVYFEAIAQVESFLPVSSALGRSFVVVALVEYLRDRGCEQRWPAERVSASSKHRRRVFATSTRSASDLKISKW